MRTVTPLRPLSVLAILTLVVPLLGGATAEAGPRRPANPPADDAPEPSRNQEPPSISIRKRIGDAERADLRRREDERRGRLGGEIVLWNRTWDPAARRLRAALDEAERTLSTSWGPFTKNLGYSLGLEIERFRNGPALPAPDALLEADIRRALTRLEQGASACLDGKPTTAQLHLAAGRRGLDKVQRAIAEYMEAGGPAAGRH